MTELEIERGPGDIDRHQRAMGTMSVDHHETVGPSTPPSSTSSCTGTTSHAGRLTDVDDRGDRRSDSWAEDRLNQLIETLLIEVYRCSSCKACFTQRSAVRDHMELEHSDLIWRYPSSSCIRPVVDTPLRTGDENDGPATGEAVSHDPVGSTPSAALSNALEVLVGLGKPLLTPGRVKDGEGGTDSQSHKNSNIGDGSPYPRAVYNLSEVAIDGDGEMGLTLPEVVPSKFGSNLFVLEGTTPGGNLIEQRENGGGIGLEGHKVPDTGNGRDSGVVCDESSIGAVSRIMDDKRVGGDQITSVDHTAVNEQSVNVGVLTVDKSHLSVTQESDIHVAGDMRMLLDMSVVDAGGTRSTLKGMGIQEGCNGASRDASKHEGDMERLLDMPGVIAGGTGSTLKGIGAQEGCNGASRDAPGFDTHYGISLVEETDRSEHPVAISVVLTEGTGHDQRGPSDINQVVHTASQNNPDASLFIVVSQSGDDGPSEMMEFKRSYKSNAIIPTAKSLGIVSPFPKQQRTNKKRFSCRTCSSRYASEEELASHVAKKHLRTNSFLCDICGLALASRGVFKNHVLAKHSSVKIFQCGSCEYWTKHERHYRNHVTKHGRGIWCRVCEQSFTSPARLEMHRRSEVHLNKLNPLSCQLCEYTTYKRDNLRLHMRKHDDQRPYSCTQCTYASRDGSTLKKHVMAKHSKIRPHQCGQCDFSSIDKRGLTIHLRKHSGERPFRCSLCDFSAKRRVTLTSHLQTHNETIELLA